MKPLVWTTEIRNVSELLPQADNYKKLSEHKKKKLIESLQKFNLVDLPVIDFDNTLISGHQRLVCLISMGKGDENIEVRFPNRKLTKKELKEYTLIANSQYGEIDFDMLQEYVQDVDLDLGDFGLDFGKIEIGNSDKSISEINDDLNEPEIDPKHEKQTINLKPFKQVHVLLSFTPENLIDVQEYLEKIKSLPFVEYEQIST